MSLTNLTSLYHHFDQLAESDADSDTLFASSYLRGFIALVASELGDESQALTTALANLVEEKVAEAKSELTPQDKVIVDNYWLSLQKYFN